MALDPESQNLLNLMAAANRPAWITLSPADAREQYLATRAPSQGPLPHGVTVTNRTIPGPGGPLPVRLDALRKRVWMPLVDLMALSHASLQHEERGAADLFYAESWALTGMLALSRSFQLSALAQGL